MTIYLLCHWSDGEGIDTVKGAFHSRAEAESKRMELYLKMYPDCKPRYSRNPSGYVIKEVQLQDSGSGRFIWQNS